MNMDWFDNVAPKLIHQRNQKETEPFDRLIYDYTDLFRDYKHLAKENDLLKKEVIILTHETQTDSDVAIPKNYERKIQELQGKVQMLQDELIQKYKNYAHESDQMLSRSTRVFELQQEREEKIQEEKKLMDACKNLKEEVDSLEDKNREKDKKVHTLEKEVYQLRDMLVTLEKRNKELEQENVILVKQMLEEKQKMMSEFNRMNSLFQSTKGKQQETEKSTKKETCLEEGQLYIERLSILPQNVKQKVRAHATEINDFTFNSSGSLILTASSDSNIRLWDTTTLQPKCDFRGTTQAVMSVDISYDGDLVLGSSIDCACRIWKVSTGRIRHTLIGHSGKVYAAKFAGPNNIVTGSSDRTMRIWDLSSGYSIKTMNCKSTCNTLSTGIGDQIASGHQDGVVRFWDLRAKSFVNEILNCHSSQITSVYFSSDATKILTNSKDNSLKLIDCRTCIPIYTFRDPGYRVTSPFSKASLSPDGCYIAAGSINGCLFVWNTLTGQLESSHTSHDASISCVSWNIQGSRIASCDKNGSLVLWE